MKIQEQLVTALLQKNKKIAFAESCTGGLLSAMLTDVSGASAVFECGVCSYSNRIKIEVLGVEEATIAEYTEVSIQTAQQMAEGVLKLSGADIAVSTTGIAGPTGGTEENPVGTVCIGLATKEKLFAIKKNFNEDACNNRDTIRKRCAEFSHSLALSQLKTQV